jgi:hypothetical protein
MRWLRYIERIGANRNAYRTIVVKPEREIPLRRPICGCEGDIKTCIRRME